MKHCPKCNSPMPPDELRCIRCGADQSQPSPKDSRPAKDKSWILYIFAGVTSLLVLTSNTEDVGTTNWFIRDAILGALFGISLWRIVWALRNRRRPPSADGAKKKPSGCLTALAVYFVAMIAFAMAAISISPPLKGMKTAAAPVVVALDKYRADHGFYPDSLDGLVPGFFSELPGCKPDDPSSRLHYYRDKDSGEYELICPYFMFQWHQYKSKTKEWRTAER